MLAAARNARIKNRNVALIIVYPITYALAQIECEGDEHTQQSNSDRAARRVLDQFKTVSTPFFDQKSALDDASNTSCSYLLVLRLLLFGSLCPASNRIAKPLTSNASARLKAGQCIEPTYRSRKSVTAP